MTPTATVRMCGNCPQIHLDVYGFVIDGQPTNFSLALSRKEWAKLISDYTQLAAAQDRSVFHQASDRAQ
jgi:hypothetical protein